MYYWLKTIPYSAIDMVNRHAAATGSVRYAQAASDSRYNGHSISVSFKPYSVRGACWNAEYNWGERVVLARGTLNACLNAAASKYYDQGDRGCQVMLRISTESPESVQDQKLAASSHDFEEFTKQTECAWTKTWWTGKHQAASEAISWERNSPGTVGRALTFEGSIEDWEAMEGDVRDKLKGLGL